MCRADLSVYTFSWPVDEDARFLDAHSASRRVCVEWGDVEEWSRGRRIAVAPTLLRPVEVEPDDGGV